MTPLKTEKLLSSITKLVRYNDVIARHMSSSSARTNCLKKSEPRCSEENLKKSGCYEQKKKHEKKVEETQFQSMWLNPECCQEVCINVLPRFDDLYYKTSDKSKREYTQTWIECPEMKIMPKPICCFDKLKYPPIVKRQYKKVIAKCPEGKDSEQLECHLEKNKNCLKVKAPGCRPARDPPFCIRARKVSNCKKVCTPYPSFSECSKPKVKALRPVECHCLSSVALCEFWEYLRKRGQLGLARKK